MKNKILLISRLFVGLVFMFSGFVKAVDPLGSTYKYTDYFNLAFDLSSLAQFSFVLAFVVAALEFTVGAALFFNIKFKTAAWAAAAFMIFFTPLTLYLAITNPVHDCGCFGDALVLTNWQTFLKNIIIDVFVVFCLIWRNDIPQSKLSKNSRLSIIFSIFAGVIIFEFFMYRHLPILDFRPYKIGTHIPDQMVYPEGAPRDSIVTTLVYKNTVTGEVKQFSMTDYPWNDSTWVWQSTDNVVVKEGYQPPVHDFTMVDTSGIDHTNEILESENPVLLIVIHKIEKADPEGLDRLRGYVRYANKHNYKIVALTSSNIDVIEQARKKYCQESLTYYQTDDITLKTIVRANPGIVLLNKGTIVDKWNYRDFKLK